MSTPSSPKKKPRARKLERDRTREGEPKAGSTRHATAKVTAAKKRAKPKSKVSKAESNADAMKHAMPKQSDFSKSDAKELFGWVKQSKTHPFALYRATYNRDIKWDNPPTP